MLKMSDVPLKNLRGNAARTAAIVLFSALMAVAVFGGCMVVMGIQQGIATVQNRLGADIVVTPADAASEFDAQTVLLQAEPSYFYMDKDKFGEICAVDGVAQATPQLFMASAKAACCSSKLQLVAFDPATDFVVLPWIRESFGEDAGELGTLDIVVGCNVTVYDDRILQLYGNDCHVVGQFAPTGSTLDNAVYMNFDTVKILIESSFEKGLNKFERYDPNEVISSVMIKVEPGRDVSEVARAVTEQVDGVSAATSTSMVSGIEEGLAGVSGTMWTFANVLWVLGLAMTVFVFAMTIHARRREFATMRAAGASKRLMRRVVVQEALVTCGAGGVVGVAVAAVLLYSFSGLAREVVGAGFVVPGLATAAPVALAALASTLVAAMVSAAVATQLVNGMDASLVLKEGE